MNKSKIQCEAPFFGYAGYLRVCKTGKSAGRKIIGLYSSKHDPQRITMSYARYLVCVKEGRILKKEEQVDHVDNNKTNDSISNLQILSAKQNNKKRVQSSGKARLFVALNCPACNTVFTKEKNKTYLVKGGYYGTCSRPCRNKMNTITKGLSKCDLKMIGERQKIKEFRLL